jgi:pimeloyl-ACP methyl ester carboxylesterase
MSGPAVTTGYAPAGGVSMYWESRGSGGTPLIAVHGGYGLTTMFGGLLDRFCAQRRVIAIELQGHGHTRDTGRPFTWEQFGDDIAALIGHLGLGPADLLGYSLGGGASLRCAIQHQPLVRRLVLVSTPMRRDAWFPEVLAAFDHMTSATLFEQFRHSPMYEAWSQVAPDPGAFPALIDKTGDLLRRPYDWSDEVKGLAMPVLLAYGDADSIPPAHAAEFYSLLGGGLRDAGFDGTLPGPSRLAILPGATHYNMLSAPHLAGIIEDFTA